MNIRIVFLPPSKLDRERWSWSSCVRLHTIPIAFEQKRRERDDHYHYQRPTKQQKSLISTISLMMMMNMEKMKTFATFNSQFGWTQTHISSSFDGKENKFSRKTRVKRCFEVGKQHHHQLIHYDHDDPLKNHDRIEASIIEPFPSSRIGGRIRLVLSMFCVSPENDAATMRFDGNKVTEENRGKGNTEVANHFDVQAFKAPSHSTSGGYNKKRSLLNGRDGHINHELNQFAAAFWWVTDVLVVVRRWLIGIQ